MTARLETDLEAVAANVRWIRSRTQGELMAVVKADGFGAGLGPLAHTALVNGATWLGVAGLEEARAVRRAGLLAPMLSWRNDLTSDFAWALAHGVDLAISDVGQLQAVTEAGRRTGRVARLHLHADCGMAREGAAPEDWAALCRRAHRAELDGLAEVVAVMGHLAVADRPEDPENARERARFAAAVRIAHEAGLRPRHRHLAATAAALHDRASRHTMVRVGAGLVGIDPAGGTDLRGALRLTSSVLSVRAAAAGTPVGYGHTWRAPQPTVLGVVGLGYADGIPRSSSGRGEVLVAGRRCAVVGRVSMDQVVVDLGAEGARPGAQVTVFGPGDAGEPRLEDWARWAGTIPHEIATGVGPRVHRDVVPTPVRCVS